MARKTPQVKLEETIDHLENVLESMEHPDMSHIKTLYFDGKGDWFLIGRKYRGKYYKQLGLSKVDTTNGDADPEPHEIAATNDDGFVTAKHVAPEGNHMELKPMSKVDAVKLFEKQLKAAKEDLDILNGVDRTPKAAVVKKRALAS